jgi:hypothetical protein
LAEGAITSSSICLAHDVKIIEARREMVMQIFISTKFSLYEKHFKE